MHRRNCILAAMAIVGTLVLVTSPAAARDRVHLLRDIFPGEDSSMPAAAGVVNGVFLFFATDPEHGRELWRSDGTAAGTELVRDIHPGPPDGIGFGGWTIAGGRLAFVASDGTGAAQLWTSDGTADGTVLMLDTSPGDTSAHARLFTPDGERVWFTVQTNFYDQQRRGVEDLWVSDLTSATTTRVMTVGFWEPGFSGGAGAVTSLTPFRGGVLVARKDQIECCESVMLTHVDLSSPESTPLYRRDLGGHLRYLRPLEPAIAGDTAYLAIDPLFSADECSLLRLTDSDPVVLAAGVPACGLTPLTPFGGDLLLAAERPSLQLERAAADRDTLTPVADLGAARLAFRGQAATPSASYFAVNRDDGDELWRATNAVDPPLLMHRFPRAAGGYIQSVTASGSGVVVFVTDNFGRDPRVWKSDGPSTATRPIAVLPYDTSAGWLAPYGRAVLLQASDPAYGAELWVIPRATPCTGDCDANGVVTIEEIIRGVGIGLGSSDPDACAAADANTDQSLSIDELVAAVANALDNCGGDEPSP